jgi:hypothetical protein
MFKARATRRFVNASVRVFSGVSSISRVDRDKLVVDDTCQREIGRRDTMYVHQISENFDRSKFAPVIAGPLKVVSSQL